MTDKPRYPDVSYAFMHFAEAVGLRAARELMPLLGIPHHGDPFRDAWRVFLDETFDYPDHLIDPPQAEERAWDLIRRQDEELGTGGCLTRSFECGFYPNEAFSHNYHRWVDALRDWASGNAGTGGALVEFWWHYRHRTTEIEQARQGRRRSVGPTTNGQVRAGIWSGPT